MSLSVIGAGYGRTGTLSLKAALETLGLKCHHMIEVINNPGEDALWMAAARGEPVDWDALLAGYRAAVDWPACHFYRELAAHYPDAKVVLTVRDPSSWYESIANTTLRVIKRGMAEDPTRQNLGTELVVKAAFEGELDDPDHGVAIFNAHTEAVKAAIAPERLLVYEVRAGWEPLCEFLDRPVPAEPFPHVNTRAEFDNIFFPTESSGGTDS